MKSLVNFPRYEGYKESGVDWLEEVPEHWTMSRLGGVFIERREKVSDVDFPPLSVTKNGVVPQLDSAAKTQDGDNRKKVKSGDFVINSRSDRKGSSGISFLDGSVSLINIVLEPKEVNPSFVNFLLKSYSFVEEYYRVGRGIVADLWTTRYDEMRTILLAMPAESEQKNIATFLNQKTAQIDQAIEIKKKQIELLKERQQVLIQQAVTKGLDPEVRMRDSGVEWIGEVPEHWEVTPLKRLAKLSPKVDTVRFKDDLEVTFLPMEKVSEKGVITTDLKRKLGEVRQGFTPFNENDVIVAKITPCFENGKSAYLEKIPTGFGFGSTEFHVLRSYGAISGWFLYYVVRSHSFLAAGEGMMTGSAGQKRVPSSFIRDFLVALPNENEQKQIVAYLKESSLKIMESIGLYKKQIKKLQEYKSSLINSAVTGKIKITPDMIAAEE